MGFCFFTGKKVKFRKFQLFSWFYILLDQHMNLWHQLNILTSFLSPPPSLHPPLSFIILIPQTKKISLSCEAFACSSGPCTLFSLCPASLCAFQMAAYLIRCSTGVSVIRSGASNLFSLLEASLVFHQHLRAEVLAGHVGCPPQPLVPCVGLLQAPGLRAGGCTAPAPRSPLGLGHGRNKNVNCSAAVMV